MMKVETFAHIINWAMYITCFALVVIVAISAVSTFIAIHKASKVQEEGRIHKDFWFSKTQEAFAKFLKAMQAGDEEAVIAAQREHRLYYSRYCKEQDRIQKEIEGILHPPKKQKGGKT